MSLGPHVLEEVLALDQAVLQCTFHPLFCRLKWKGFRHDDTRDDKEDLLKMQADLLGGLDIEKNGDSIAHGDHSELRDRGGKGCALTLS